ncbi:MAG: hypothetical protein KatS3mg129_0675 [Leptospiraceae bacterium]|nr:MAG: hypothetical protein KatS3mg129_0675 [Leptospiraceae bacterium]
MKKLIYFLLLFVIFDFLNAEELRDWKITLLDNKTEIINREKLDTNWSEVQIPISFDDVISTKSKILWLRKEIQLDKMNQYSLILNKVNGNVEVYFNEKLLIKGPNYPQGTLLVHLPMNLYKEDINIIAIKFYFTSLVANGIHGPILLEPTPKAIEEYYFQNFKHITNSIFLMGIGFFLLTLYWRFKTQTYYFYISVFYLLASISSFFSNDIILDEVLFSNKFYSISMGLPIFLPVLFLRFFTLYFNIPYLFHKIDIIFCGLIFIITVLSGFINVYYAKLMNLSWLIIFIFVFIYAIYVILLNLYQRISFRNIMSFIFLTYLFILGINSIVDWNYFKGERFLYHFDVTIVLLIPAILVIMEIIQLQRNVEKKEGQFQSFDILQTKLFSYILTALKLPIKDLIEALLKVHPKELNPSQVKSIIFNIEDLEKNLNDILELSRLEVLEEPESYVEINVKDFLQAVLSKSNISCTINVDPDLTLETSLELVNSLLIRLIDFPGFGSFQHIDLVIISDENYNILFKFFLYNKNLKVLNRIYNILREKLPDQEGLWIQWKIIKETIRILGGKLKIKLYSKKYLYIEFILKAKEPDSDIPKTILPKKKEKVIPLVYLYYVESKTSKQKKEQKNKTIWQKIKELFQKKIA